MWACCAMGVMAFCVIRCSPLTPATEGYANQLAMRGRTVDDVVRCAGPALREVRLGEKTEFQYYREAPILEESAIASKGSLPGVHHGCWATVVVHGNRVEEVRYRYVPDFFDASNDCEDIFASCVR